MENQEAVCVLRQRLKVRWLVDPSLWKSAVGEPTTGGSPGGALPSHAIFYLLWLARRRRVTLRAVGFNCAGAAVVGPGACRDLRLQGTRGLKAR